MGRDETNAATIDRMAKTADGYYRLPGDTVYHPDGRRGYVWYVPADEDVHGSFPAGECPECGRSHGRDHLAVSKCYAELRNQHTTDGSK